MLRLKLGDYAIAGCPVTFWDIFGDQGHPGIVERAFVVPQQPPLKNIRAFVEAGRSGF